MPTKRLLTIMAIDQKLATKLIAPLGTEEVVYIEVPDPIPPCPHCGAPVDANGKWDGSGDYESDPNW
jgi:hypothetical protein